jgi:hypothetical protein
MIPTGIAERSRSVERSEDHRIPGSLRPTHPAKGCQNSPPPVDLATQPHRGLRNPFWHLFKMPFPKRLFSGGLRRAPTSGYVLGTLRVPALPRHYALRLTPSRRAQCCSTPTQSTESTTPSTPGAPPSTFSRGGQTTPRRRGINTPSAGGTRCAAPFVDPSTRAAIIHHAAPRPESRPRHSPPPLPHGTSMPIYRPNPAISPCAAPRPESGTARPGSFPRLRIAGAINRNEPVFSMWPTATSASARLPWGPPRRRSNPARGYGLPTLA